MTGRWQPHWLSPEIADAKPPGCWGHTLSYCEGKLYVVCGNMKSSSKDPGHHEILCLDTNGWECKRISTLGANPGSRDSHSATVIGPPGHKSILVFGGTDGDRKYNKVHLLDLNTQIWKALKLDSPPPPRESHTATLIGKTVIIFGGNGSPEADEGDETSSRYLNDLHFLDSATMTWSSPKATGKLPRGRESHAAAAHEGRLVIFGGDIGDFCLADVHMLDLKKIEWQQMSIVSPQKPKARAGHVMVPHPEGLLMFGGVTADGKSCHDCWVLTLGPCAAMALAPHEAAWRQLECTGSEPSGRFAHAADAGDGALFVFGGLCNEEPVDDLHVLMLEPSAAKFDVKPRSRLASKAPVSPPAATHSSQGEDGGGEASSDYGAHSSGGPQRSKPEPSTEQRVEQRPPKTTSRPANSAGPSISFGAAISGGKKTTSRGGTEGQHPREGKVTSYNMYCTAIRKSMKREMPEVPAREIERRIGQRWQMMTMEEKRPYEESASRQNALMKLQNEQNEKLMQPPPSAAHSDHFDENERRRRLKDQQAEMNAKRQKFRSGTNIQDSQSFNSKLSAGVSGLPPSLPGRGMFMSTGRFGPPVQGIPPFHGDDAKEDALPAYGEPLFDASGAIPMPAQPRMLGAHITGTVDAMFNSGYLATVRMGGMMYRAVLFSPVLHAAPSGAGPSTSSVPPSAAAAAAAAHQSQMSQFHAHAAAQAQAAGLSGMHHGALSGLGSYLGDRHGMM